MEGTCIILQARMGSTRFPGKVLQNLQGIPLLSHCIRRLKAVSPDIPVIVATSTIKHDTAVARLGRAEGCIVFRGAEADVLDRFYQAARSLPGIKNIIRATADNPLVDPVEARRVAAKISTGQWDYVCGFHARNGRGLPKGVGVEAFCLQALYTAWSSSVRPEHREHINDYFFDNKRNFRIAYLRCPAKKSCPDLTVSVDTPEDMMFVLEISRTLGKQLPAITTEDLVRYWNARHA